MKKINYYSCFLSLAIICFFSSCSTTKYGAHFQPSHSSPSNYARAEKVEESAVAFKEEKSDEAIEHVAVRSGAEEVNTDALPKAVTLEKLLTEVKTVDETEFTERQQQLLAETREKIQEMSRKEKRELRREIRKLKLADYTKDLPVYENLDVAQDRRGEVNILALVFAFLLPPLGVYLHQGEINNRFWISVILSLLFWVPGQIYAVLTVLGII